jgi:hypothetical protein
MALDQEHDVVEDLAKPRGQGIARVRADYAALDQRHRAERLALHDAVACGGGAGIDPEDDHGWRLTPS